PVSDSIQRVVRDAFEPAHYLRDQPDLVRAGIDPVAHYLRFGWQQRRSPHPDFDVGFYLDTYPDVAASGMEPFYHFLAFGRQEGRLPNAHGSAFRRTPMEGPRPEVSILIPAFRPDFLDLCIACVLAQSFKDFELIISDDSSGDAVGSVVSKWQDPRIRYRSNPTRQVLGANRDFLITEARGRYIKFLFDDDMLFPQAVEHLVTAARREGAALVYHARYDINAVGAVRRAAIAAPLGEERRIDPDLFFTGVIGTSRNFIGEPSNILLDSDVLKSIPQPFFIDGRRMRFLADVALYANIAERLLPIVGLSRMDGAFRHHQRQNSNRESPHYSAGLFEWEYLLRWATDRGHLNDTAYKAAIARIIEGMYLPSAARFPELHAFITLSGRGDNGEYLSREYIEMLNAAHAAVDRRVEESKMAATES
ncbi:MAG: glycosyltransferase family 2 protein, partial [Bacillati bacterium]